MRNLVVINITADDSLVIEGAEMVDFGFDAYCDLRGSVRRDEARWVLFRLIDKYQAAEADRHLVRCLISWTIPKLGSGAQRDFN
jgi:hypothetical protein